MLALLPLLSALKRQTREGCCESEAGLAYALSSATARTTLERPYFKINK